MSNQVSMDLPVPLDQLVQSTQVSVVQSLDVGALQTTLQWIIDRLPVASGGPAGDDDAVAAKLKELQDSNNQLQEQVKALQEKAFTTPNGQEIKDGEASNVPSAAADLQALQARIEALEAAKQDGTATAAGDNTISGQPAKSDSGTAQDVLDQLAQLQARITQLEARAAAEPGQVQMQQQSAADAAVGGQDASSMQDLQQQVADLSRLGNRLPQLEGQLADLMSRLEAAELRRDMASSGAELPVPAADSTNASHAAIEAASTVEDTLPLIKSLYDQLAGKTGRNELDPLVRRLAELGTSLSDLAGRCAALESNSPAGDRVLAGPGSGKRASLVGGAETATGKLLDADAVLGRVFDAETSLGELGGLVRQLQDAVSGQQAGLQTVEQKVDDLAHALAGKADQASVDSLVVSAALSQSIGAAASPGSGTASDGAPAPAAGLEALLKDLLADKATKAELDVLRSQLSSKPSRDELAQAQAAAQQALSHAQSALDRAVESAGPMEAADQPREAREDVAALSQQLGDMMAELAHLRSQLAGLQSDAARSAANHNLAVAIPTATLTAVPTAVAADVASSPKPTSDAALKEIASLREQLDWVAHAVSILAVGMESARPLAATADGSAQVVDSSSGREPRTPRGALDRLIRLLGRQGVNHKMDWFDPHALNQMASKLAQMDAALSQAGAGAAQARAVPDAGLKDLEAQLRRLSKEVRGLKERLGTTAATGGRTADSDHAMLSGKPLMGYRCMACDRPLDKLQERPGPFIPTYQMPVRLPHTPEASNRAAMMRAPVVGNISPESSQTKFTKKGYEQGQRGPQNWYEDSKGLPAEALPVADVGPKLPPGGWRGSTAGAANSGKPAGLLPELGIRSSPNTPPTAKAGPLAEVQDHSLLQNEMLPTNF